MLFRRNIGKQICNGILFLITILLLVPFYLNLVNPNLPPVRCEGNKSTDSRISHKFNGDTVTTIDLLLVVILVPLIQIIITEIFVPINYFPNDPNASSEDKFSWNIKTKLKYGTLNGLRWYRDYIFAIIFMMLLVDIGKTTLKAPRPHFIDSCRPNFTQKDCRLGWAQKYECINHNIPKWILDDASKSFPSGHAALSMFSAVFMILYQQSKLSIKRHGSIAVMWCHISWLAWGFFCALSRVADKRHHPIDITIGGLIGIIGAVYTVIYLCRNFKDTLQWAVRPKVITKACSTSSTVGIV